ncbi:MAG: zinc-binding dehydrogenase [Bacteroidota bacterium]
MPSTVRLTLYSSETLHTDTATPTLQTIVDKVKAGKYKANIFKNFSFEELPLAQTMMEANQAAGKLVVTI